jgi:PilZ domain-containing protein
MATEKNPSEPEEYANDRRTSRRFPLRLAIKYRGVGSLTNPEWTSSESVNISSSGLLFTTTGAFKPGQAVEAFLTWPVWLDKRIPLKLVIKGPIVRSAGDQSAIRFERYEFKTTTNS